MKSGESMKNSTAKKMFQQLHKSLALTTTRKKKKKWICHYCDKVDHIKNCFFNYLVDLIPKREEIGTCQTEMESQAEEMSCGL